MFTAASKAYCKTLGTQFSKAVLVLIAHLELLTSAFLNVPTEILAVCVTFSC